MKSRFNVIDLVVILAALALAWHYGKGYLHRKAPPVRSFLITFYAGEIRRPTWEALHPGEVVRDGENNRIIGRVVRITLRPAVIDTMLPDDTILESVSRKGKSLFLEVAARGTDLGNGTVGIGSDRLQVGSQVNVTTAELGIGTLVWEVRR